MSRLVGLVALPWALALLLAVDSALTALGIPPGDQRPLVIRAAVLVAAWAPGLLWWFSPIIGRWPGLGSLIDGAPISLSLDEAGVRIRRGDAIQTVPWPELSQAVVFDGWPPQVELILASGARVTLPGEYARPRDSNGDETSLFTEIGRYRPALAERLSSRVRRTSYAFGLLVVLLGVVAIVLLVGR